MLKQLGRRALPVLRLGLSRALGSKVPFQVTLSLTNRCNFRCNYCDIPLQARPEMSTDEWRGCIDELAAAGMGRASLMGGEPLLRPDAGAIIAHLRRHEVHASMNTNGWLVPERLDEVAQLDLVCVTLDGTAEVHDAQRHPGSYERVMAALDALRRRGVPTVTMTVLTPSSSTEANVDHVLSVARDHGIRAFFQLEHHASMDVVMPIGPRQHDTAIAALARALRRRKREGQPVGNSYPMLDVQERDGRRLGGDCSHCYAGRYFAYVMSDGTVAPCLFTQSQVERGLGRRIGFARAFSEMPAPEGPGCACVPIHEVNRALDLDPRVAFGALDLARRGLWRAPSTPARLREVGPRRGAPPAR